MLSLEYLSELLESNRAAASAKVHEFSIRGRQFHFNHAPAIMGVINLSPDSWYRESVCLNVDSAFRRLKMLAAQGADIIDIGSESTLAHAARVDATGQSSKLLPLLDRARALAIPISIETYEPAVARRCLEAGAALVNLTGQDTSGEIFRMARDFEAAVIICYVQGRNVREVAEFNFGEDPIILMRDFFAREIDRAKKLGVDRIFIDPGLGFYYRNLQDSSLRIRHQIQVFLNSFRLRTLGYPICHALPHAFEFFGEEVRSAEPFFTVMAALGKTDLFRTHEVPKIKAVLDTMKVIQAR